MNKDPEFNCLDCGVNTLHEVHEYYMLENYVWEVVNPDCAGMLCIGCVEKGLGRKLGGWDFSECSINDDFNYPMSERLVDRLTNFE